MKIICDLKKEKEVEGKLKQLELFNEGDFYVQTSSQNEYGKIPKTFSTTAQWIHPLNIHRSPMRGGFRI